MTCALTYIAQEKTKKACQRCRAKFYGSPTGKYCVDCKVILMDKRRHGK